MFEHGSLKLVMDRETTPCGCPPDEKPEGMSLADAALRGAGLSANKLLAIRDLASKCLDGTVPTLREAHKLSDAEHDLSAA